ncbi:SDR family oxidoreductase [Aquisediminimonas sediminicola]|uniref:SDR family oxidoreductase n=1 Tax=Alteraquisediminimonas sediminicola TaxID=2676787 RepID=UPI0031B83A37
MKLALITGGCRRIGAAIAARLAKSGYQLALHGHEDAIPSSDLRAVMEQCDAKWAGFTCELADSAAVEALMPKVADHFGCWPNLLVNNASLFEDDRVENLTAEGLQRHYAINLVAPALLSKAMANAPRMKVARVIVNILDQRILHPPTDQLSYTLSKLGLTALTMIEARALAPYVRVCGVAPGLTLPTADYVPGQMERLAAEMPLERLPQPDDIARAVEYLAENESVTGQVVYVDGGAHLRSFERDFLFMQQGDLN